jgi:RNA polymerase sigma-70 factor (ECF subfamily)
MDPHDTCSQGAPSPPSPDVVNALVSNHREFLVFLERRVGSRAVAEDILQEAFVRGLDKLEALRNDESAVAWFYRVLRNAIVDHHRRHASAGRALEAFAVELDQRTDPDTDVESAVCRCISQLTGTLKPEYAEALQRIEVDGVAVKDYALEAGISSGNAAIRVFRARQALRAQVARSCGTCAAHGCLDCTCSTSSSKSGCGSR